MKNLLIGIIIAVVLGACSVTPEQRANRVEKTQIAHEKYARVVAACNGSDGGQMVYERGSSTVSTYTRLTIAQMKSASCIYPWSARTANIQ